jgi:signal transduction histidine kinase
MQTRRHWEIAWIAQAALIVLPVAVLSGVALHFLREDKVAIEQEARDLARSLAPETARRIGEAAGARLAEELKSGHLKQGDIVDGQGLAMPDYPRLPAPADWPAKLPPVQAQWWRTAQEAAYRSDSEATRKALTTLAGSGVSTAARANAQLGLLAVAERRGDAAMLIHQGVVLARQYPVEVTEAGLPVAGLALLLALRHVSGGNPPQELLSEVERNITLYPSFLSPELLDAAGRAATALPSRSAIAALRANWPKQEADRESTRELMRRLAGQLAGRKTPTPLAFYRGPARVLAMCVPRDTGWRVTLVPEDLLRRAWHPNLPAYMGAQVEIGGSRWSILGEPRGPTFMPLASAAGSIPAGSQYPFNLILELAKPELLYAPYHRRMMLIEWLIFSAAAAALLGLLGLWRNHRVQAQLGEMKSNLVSSVSHELRAPIAAVRLMAESLESGRVEGEAKQKDYYRLIVRECRRLSSLVENVLDFARIDQGRKLYRFEPLDPAALLRHTLMLMEPGAAERQVRLSMTDPPRDFENLQPSWDGEAVEQSLVNLLDNAIKHSPAGAEVRVETETSPEVVRFWVTDQGPGIPAAEHRKIFDLFYRRGSELRRETEGVGIGLSIVRHVAEAHGGHVLVESVVGQGSRFGLELPR